MSKFKVGDEVVVYDHTRGVVVLHEPKEEYPYLVWNSEIDETEWCSEEALQLLTPVQTVYAVCDEKGEIMELCLKEEYAEAYIGNPRKSYHIRPFALRPINE